MNIIFSPGNFSYYYPRSIYNSFSKNKFSLGQFFSKPFFSTYFLLLHYFYRDFLFI